MTRLNYTGRRRITLNRLELQLRDGPSGVLLDVTKVDLVGLGLAADALVVVEPYRQLARRRIDCGTVGSLEVPVSEPLPEFNTADGVLVDVKVIGVGADDGKLLAAARHVRPEASTAGGKDPILPIAPSQDLGQRLWRIELDSTPTVFVNAGIGDWKGFTREPHFQALVFPEVVRQVALWVYENRETVEDDDAALAQWHRFLTSIGKDVIGNPPDEDEEAAWAEDAAAAFCRRHKFLDRILLTITSEGP